MSRGALLALLLLGLATVASGVGVVYAKYLSRAEFARLQALSSERHGLEVEWGRLRLEEAALTTHPRVEERARRLLGMHLPSGAEVRVIEGDGDGPR